MNFIRSLSTERSISEDALKDTIHLLDKGNTIPFIARYRKESTGGLDEVKLEIIQEAIATHKRFSERLKSICDALKDRNQFSPEIQRQLEQATRITELEDIYLPYKPKRRTRGTIAKENGLEPLAKILMNQEERKPQQAAARFVKGTINTQEEALQGARDIVAEWINENPRTRLFLRTQFERTALFQSKLIKNKAEEGANFKDYFSFEEPLIKMPSHRFMAAMRGHKAGILTISCVPNEEKALLKLEQLYCKVSHSGSDQLKLAIKESYKRLICPKKWAIVDVGTDQLAKVTLLKWPHRILSKSGEEIQSGNDAIAGPLCFAGDTLKDNINADSLKKGDPLLVTEAGAYTFSLSNKFNGRTAPKWLLLNLDGELLQTMKKESMYDELHLSKYDWIKKR
jgi:transcriptional accessory protein Tex/SPT6